MAAANQIKAAAVNLFNGKAFICLPLHPAMFDRCLPSGQIFHHAPSKYHAIVPLLLHPGHLQYCIRKGRSLMFRQQCWGFGLHKASQFAHIYCFFDWFITSQTAPSVFRPSEHDAQGCPFDSGTLTYCVKNVLPLPIRHLTRPAILAGIWQWNHQFAVCVPPTVYSTHNRTTRFTVARMINTLSAGGRIRRTQRV